MLIKYQIRNTFSITTAQTVNVINTITEPLTAIITGGTVTPYKSIILPIEQAFYPVDYTDDVNKFVQSETKKAINPYFDAETIKYTFKNNDLKIIFKFWDVENQTLTVNYNAAGFTGNEIVRRRNSFKNSFFRLYFYDVDNSQDSNLLFIEDLDIGETRAPIIPFNSIYWLRNDEFFMKNIGNRKIYMVARFFNAKTGKIKNFVNVPNTVTVPINISFYSDPINRQWRNVAFEILNPRNNGGDFNFIPVVPYGTTTVNTITLSELVMA
jgi:hypothetical protein